MTKGKKVALILGVILLGILLLIIGATIGLAINNKKSYIGIVGKNFKELNARGDAYGIEYRILESEISSAEYNGVDKNLTMNMDLQITLRNTTDKDFVLNSDVLYLQVEGCEVDGSNGHYETVFDNEECLLCISDILSSNTHHIASNNGVYSIHASLNLKLHFPYAEWNSGLLEKMNTIGFRLIYNGEKVLEFAPYILVDKVAGSLDG